MGRMPVSHPSMGAVSAVAAELPEHPDGQVYTTVEMMTAYARMDALTPEVAALAVHLCVPGNPHATVDAIWAFAKSHIQFRFDRDIAQEAGLAGGDDVAEVLIRPVDMASMIRDRGMGLGDCDDFTMFVCALMLACGIPCRIITVAALDSANPDAYSHVYACAYVDGVRIPVDASHGKFCGWEAPDQSITRRLEYPVDGVTADGGGDGPDFLHRVGKYALLGFLGWTVWHSAGPAITGQVTQVWNSWRQWMEN